MTISERIRLLRQERKWTQAELAERLGIHQKQVSAYERGVNLPSTDILIKLAEVFDVAPATTRSRLFRARQALRDRLVRYERLVQPESVGADDFERWVRSMHHSRAPAETPEQES